MRSLSMRIVTYLIKYLGEFKFIFETILDYESGDQMGSFDAKKTDIENLMLGHLFNAVTLRKSNSTNRGSWPQPTPRSQRYSNQ